MSPIPDDDLPPPSDGVDVLRAQQEANEQLVLATLRAHEDTDVVREALEHAEQTAGLLKRSEEDLRATAEFRERLMGMIGHDLRGPLGTILMASDLVIAHGNLTEADGRLVGRIVDSGQRMARMINQLVEFTRGRLGGGFELTLANVDLGKVCWNVAEELRISSAAEIQLLREGDLTGRWDADRLAEVLANIIGNAIEHATIGAPIVVDVRQEQRTVVIEITNRGKEIPAELLPVIFTAFRRAVEARSDVRRTGGHLGLGLYIASELVGCHGGTIAARSSDGSTTFTIRLPRDFPSGDRVRAPSGPLPSVLRR